MKKPLFPRCKDAQTERHWGTTDHSVGEAEGRAKGLAGLALVRLVGRDPEGSMSYAEKFGFSLVDHAWRRYLMAFK